MITLKLSQGELEVLNAALDVYGGDIVEDQKEFWFSDEKVAFRLVIKKVKSLYKSTLWKNKKGKNG